MAEKLVTPVDVITGLPPLIAPSSPFEELPIDNPNVANWHHEVHTDFIDRRQFFTTMAGLAFREIQKELLKRKLHSDGKESYHELYSGIVVPNQGSIREIETDICSRIIPAAAGHITRRVIDINNLEENEGPLIRDMTDDEYAFFSMPHPNDESRYRHIKLHKIPVQEFLGIFIPTHSFGKQYLKKAKELLEADSFEEKRAAGYAILSRLVEITPQKIQSRFPLAERAALLAPGEALGNQKAA